MKSDKVTNLLLAAIAVLLFLNLLIKFFPGKAEAETFKLDNCITATAGEKPGGYVHVVQH